MGNSLRTLVTFKSTAFNTSEVRDYFINPCCFGDDVAKWLIGELKKKGIYTDEEPDQEDFGWYFNFQLPDSDYCLIIGHQPEDEPKWILWLERNCGLLASILGGRKRGLKKESAEIIHSILSSSPDVTGITWYYQKDFDQRITDLDELGSPEP